MDSEVTCIDEVLERYSWEPGINRKDNWYRRRVRELLLGEIGLCRKVTSIDVVLEQQAVFLGKVGIGFKVIGFDKVPAQQPYWSSSSPYSSPSYAYFGSSSNSPFQCSDSGTSSGFI